MTITGIQAVDRRFKLKPGEGADAIHREPVYAYAVTRLLTDDGTVGIGLTFTLGAGTELICQAIEHLGARLVGQEIETVMASFGKLSRELADDQYFRWLGPHKGVVHLALASLSNACFDLWAKKRGVPLWKLLLDLSPEQVMATLDLSYLEDVLTREQALALLRDHLPSRPTREPILKAGYPGYDTSVGWFNYSDEQVRDNCRRAMDAGFTAMKLKVGSADADRDIRRAELVREVAGDDATIMLDANQQWTLPRAVRIGLRLSAMSPYWIEEPTHPDDVAGHQTLARALFPVRLALGEHVANRVLFKNYLLSAAAGFIQVDALRVAGVGEFLAVSMMCRRFGVPVVPHVGDTGQLHQHLVLFNHIALGHEPLLLEHIPHLREYFVSPVHVAGGRYRTPQDIGATCDLKD